MEAALSIFALCQGGWLAAGMMFMFTLFHSVLRVDLVLLTSNFWKLVVIRESYFHSGI